MLGQEWEHKPDHMSSLKSFRLMRSRPDLPWSGQLGTSPFLAAHLPDWAGHHCTFAVPIWNSLCTESLGPPHRERKAIKQALSNKSGGCKDDCALSQATITSELNIAWAKRVLGLLALSHSRSQVKNAILVCHIWRCNDCAPIPSHICPQLHQGWCRVSAEFTCASSSQQ